MAIWRKALFPFQLLFGGGVLIRKSLYKNGVFSRYNPPKPVLVIGNISTGGTGKTPMVDYLLFHFSNIFNLGMLSRGYGRNTKGYVTVTPHATANSVGDEPLLLAQKHPNVEVSVCENRPKGLKQMLEDSPQIDAFILDDALQHLPLKPSFKIVLTTFQNPWFSDALLPVGNLRESASAAQDADVVVVTKCPSKLDSETKNTYKAKLGILPSQKLFFATLDYDTHVRGVSDTELNQFIKSPFVLLTGIANPATLLDFLNQKNADYTHKAFPDHHAFTSEEIAALSALNRPILTTEKDAVRLAPFALKEVYSLGIRVRFLEHEEKFLELIKAALKG